MSKKKAAQLGMKYGTAASKLERDLIFHFAVLFGHKCFRCGHPLTRSTFSIDHKTDWLDSHDPKTLFFSLDNIAFSHLTCNKQAPRTENPKYLRPRSAENRAYMASYYQEKIKGKVTKTKEFKARRRAYMRGYNARKKRVVKSMAD